MAIVLKNRAIKALGGMNPKAALRIRGEIAQLEIDPRTTDVVALVGRSGFRPRVGNSRVLFDREGDTIIVKDVLPRGKAYR